MVKPKPLSLGGKEPTPRRFKERKVKDEITTDADGVKWRIVQWETTDEQGRKGVHAEATRVEEPNQ